MERDYIAVCRKHWCIFLGRGLIALLIFVFLRQKDGNALYTLLTFGIPLLFILSAVVEYRTNYIAITKTKVVAHMGFIRTQDFATPLSKIQAIGLTSGLFGKIFGYHKIIIDHAGTGRSEYQFGHMANAKDFVGVLEHLTGIR